jgi:hypothetical protein
MLAVPDPSSGTCNNTDGPSYVLSECVTHFQLIWNQADGCSSPSADATVAGDLQQMYKDCSNPQTSQMTCNTGLGVEDFANGVCATDSTNFDNDWFDYGCG